MIPFRNLLKKYHAANNSISEKLLITELVDYIANLLHRGFIDTDRNYYKNYGLLEGKIACLDTGNLREDPNLLLPHHFNLMFTKVFEKTRRWLCNHYPEDVEFFDAQIHKKLVDTKAL